MLTNIVQERAIRSFYFYMNGSLYQGMRYQNKLYQLVEVFGAKNQQSASLLSASLAKQGYTTVVTVSSRQYRVWTELQNLAETDDRPNFNASPALQFV